MPPAHRLLACVYAYVQLFFVRSNTHRKQLVAAVVLLHPLAQLGMRIGHHAPTHAGHS